MCIRDSTVPVPDVNTDTLSLPSVKGEPVASTNVPVLANVRSEEYLNITTPEPPATLAPPAPPPVFAPPTFPDAERSVPLPPPPNPPVPILFDPEPPPPPA